MANIKQQVKRNKTNEKKRLKNASFKSSVKTAVKAVEAVDECVGRVCDATLEMGGAVLITADHGNADRMIGDDGNPFTPHSTNPVPFCVVGYDCELKETGRLADIAPTMLTILCLEQPKEMNGESMIK